MLSGLASFSGALLTLPVAFVVSWAARQTIRSLTRRAVRRAQSAKGGWRVRLDRLADGDQTDTRKRQRADAAARMLGHLVTGVIFVFAAFTIMHFLGVDPVVALSGAGFVGVALALSGQDLIKDMIAGTMALLEDRYAAGDDVTFSVGGHDVSGTVDLIGAVSVRLRSTDGATWHVGYAKIDSVINRSQLPATTSIEVPLQKWSHLDDAAVADILTASSNDVGLTGVIFMRDIEMHEPAIEQVDDSSAAITVQFKTNRPLTTAEEGVVRSKLIADI